VIKRILSELNFFSMRSIPDIESIPKKKQKRSKTSDHRTKRHSR